MSEVKPPKYIYLARYRNPADKYSGRFHYARISKADLRIKMQVNYWIPYYNCYRLTVATGELKKVRW